MSDRLLGRRYLALFLFSLVTFSGYASWWFITQCQVAKTTQQVDFDELSYRNISGSQQIELQNFAIVDTEPLKDGRYEYMLTVSPDSVDDLTPSGGEWLYWWKFPSRPLRMIVIRRRVNLDGSLRNMVNNGEIEGKISNSRLSYRQHKGLKRFYENFDSNDYTVMSVDGKTAATKAAAVWTSRATIIAFLVLLLFAIERPSNVVRRSRTSEAVRCKVVTEGLISTSDYLQDPGY